MCWPRCNESLTVNGSTSRPTFAWDERFFYLFPSRLSLVACFLSSIVSLKIVLFLCLFRFVFAALVSTFKRAFLPSLFVSFLVSFSVIQDHLDDVSLHHHTAAGSLFYNRNRRTRAPQQQTATVSLNKSGYDNIILIITASQATQTLRHQHPGPLTAPLRYNQVPISSYPPPPDNGSMRILRLSSSLYKRQSSHKSTLLSRS